MLLRHYQAWLPVEQLGLQMLVRHGPRNVGRAALLLDNNVMGRLQIQHLQRKKGSKTSPGIWNFSLVSCAMSTWTAMRLLAERIHIQVHFFSYQALRQPPSGIV